ncbi:MAG: response regulator transcription factor [Deltaproteobacteria bacterium]|nr:response regulator transcription factor [Deltaproteobacteria bacterium]
MRKNDKLIMIVDDDQDILTVLEGNLKLAGFKVETFLTGNGMLQAIDRVSPDLLILDLTLPDIDGIQLCRRLRELGFDFPVIMLTARDGLSDKVLGLECGADDYMVKPFAFLELQARIKTCLRRRSLAEKDEHAPLEFGPLTIDRKERRVKLSGREIELTKKEFNLLKLLAENRERVMSRDEIRRALWGKRQLYSWSRTIDVHIRHLRLKLESDPNKPTLIKTVVGVGYRFFST